MPETIGNVYLNIPLKTYQCKYEISLIKTFLAINSIFEEKPRAALQLPGRPAETRILAQSRWWVKGFAWATLVQITNCPKSRDSSTGFCLSRIPLWDFFSCITCWGKKKTPTGEKCLVTHKRAAMSRTGGVIWSPCEIPCSAALGFGSPAGRGRGRGYCPGHQSAWHSLAASRVWEQMFFLGCRY